MPLLVRNTSNSPCVFSKKDVTITWAISGDPMGNDLQRVPDILADDVDFLNSIDRGLLTVESGSDQEVVDKIAAQARVVVRSDDVAAAAAHEAVMDRRQDRDLISVPCIGPALNGRGGECDQSVLVRSANRGDVPSLCPKHESLAPQFYLIDSGSKGEGATENRPGQVTKVWKRPEMTAPQRG